MTEQKSLLLILAAGKTTFYDAHLKEAFSDSCQNAADASCISETGIALKVLVSRSRAIGARANDGKRPDRLYICW